MSFNNINEETDNIEKVVGHKVRLLRTNSSKKVMSTKSGFANLSNDRGIEESDINLIKTDSTNIIPDEFAPTFFNQQLFRNTDIMDNRGEKTSSIRKQFVESPGGKSFHHL